jgi:hypothetical protein
MNWKQFLSGGPEKVEAATAALRKEMSDCMACMGRWHEACMPRADRLTLLVMSIENDMAPTRDWEPYATYKCQWLFRTLLPGPRALGQHG